MKNTGLTDDDWEIYRLKANVNEAILQSISLIKAGRNHEYVYDLFEEYTYNYTYTYKYHYD